MTPNKTMLALLAKHSVPLTEPIPEDSSYPIWCKTDTAGRAYWGVSSFCGLDRHPIKAGQELSYLEWDGNEVYLSADTNAQTARILRQAIGILKFWRKEVETKYPETAFYLLASYDNGDLLEAEGGESPTRSITLRFWADRGNDKVICLDGFDDRAQPLLFEYCPAVKSLTAPEKKL